MSSLKQLSLGDNCLGEVPESLAAAPALTALWLYGNSLARVPPSLASHPTLKYLWLEGETILAQSEKLPFFP
jgi:Leucine-rich repeat (LRR) protein